MSALPGWPRGLQLELAAAYVGLSTGNIYNEQKAGTFPQPVVLRPGRMVWLKEDLDRWLDEKAGRAVAGDGSEWQV